MRSYLADERSYEKFRINHASQYIFMKVLLKKEFNHFDAILDVFQME